jgi:hypothetical protein
VILGSRQALRVACHKRGRYGSRKPCRQLTYIDGRPCHGVYTSAMQQSKASRHVAAVAASPVGRCGSRHCHITPCCANHRKLMYSGITGSFHQAPHYPGRRPGSTTHQTWQLPHKKLHGWERPSSKLMHHVHASTNATTLQQGSVLQHMLLFPYNPTCRANARAHAQMGPAPVAITQLLEKRYHARKQRSNTAVHHTQQGVVWNTLLLHRHRAHNPCANGCILEHHPTHTLQAGLCHVTACCETAA